MPTCYSLSIQPIQSGGFVTSPASMLQCKKRVQNQCKFMWRPQTLQWVNLLSSKSGFGSFVSILVLWRRPWRPAGWVDAPRSGRAASLSVTRRQMRRWEQDLFLCLFIVRLWIGHLMGMTWGSVREVSDWCLLTGAGCHVAVDFVKAALFSSSVNYSAWKGNW